MEENRHFNRAVIWDAGINWPTGAHRVKGKGSPRKHRRRNSIRSACYLDPRGIREDPATTPKSPWCDWRSVPKTLDAVELMTCIGCFVERQTDGKQRQFRRENVAGEGEI